MEYPIVIAPLSEDEGGGFVGYAPDLIGCMGDGDTPEAALEDTLAAVQEWLETARRRPNFVIPRPGARAERMKADQQAMASVIARLADRHEQIDQQLGELQRQIEEIQERIDHAEGWDRFSQIIGAPVRLSHIRRLTVTRAT